MASYYNYKRKYKNEIRTIKQQQSEAIKTLKEAERKEKELKNKALNMTPFECEVEDILHIIHSATKTNLFGITQTITDEETYPITKKQLIDIIKQLRKSHYTTLNGGFQESSDSVSSNDNNESISDEEIEFKSIKKKKVELSCECSANYRCSGQKCSCKKLDRQCTENCGCYGVFDMNGNPICCNN